MTILKKHLVVLKSTMIFISMFTFFTSCENHNDKLKENNNHKVVSKNEGNRKAKSYNKFPEAKIFIKPKSFDFLLFNIGDSLNAFYDKRNDLIHDKRLTEENNKLYYTFENNSKVEFTSRIEDKVLKWIRLDFVQFPVDLRKVVFGTLGDNSFEDGTPKALWSNANIYIDELFSKKYGACENIEFLPQYFYESDYDFSVSSICSYKLDNHSIILIFGTSQQQLIFESDNDLLAYLFKDRKDGAAPKKGASYVSGMSIIYVDNSYLASLYQDDTNSKQSEKHKNLKAKESQLNDI